MIYILLVHQYSFSQLRHVLSEIFDCSIDRIKVVSIDEFNSLTEELDVSTLDCVCVFSFVRGDVSQLLQLYRYRIDETDIIRRTIDVASRSRIACFIPYDSLDGWIYVGKDDISKHAHQIECGEDDCFLFQVT